MKIIHFIGREKGAAEHDLARRVTDFLLRLEEGKSTPDLSRTLVVLPGKNAIRLLTDQLAQTGTGLFSPDFITSGGLIRFGLKSAVLLPAEQKLIWQELLQKTESNEYNGLFPNGLDTENQQLISGLAENLANLQTELNRELCSFADAKKKLEKDISGLWTDLADLEEKFNEQLKKHKLPEPLSQLQDAKNDWKAFTPYDHIVIAAVPDLPKPAKERLALLAKDPEKNLHILVDAPPDMKFCFDEWGIVKPDAAKAYLLDFEQGRNRIHIAQNPADLARLARELLPDENGIFNSKKTILATADPALVPWLKRELKSVPGMPEIYDPAGLTTNKLDIAPLLQQLYLLAESSQISVVRALFAHRSFRAYLAKICGTSEDDLLSMLDLYRLEHLVDVLDHDSPPAAMPLQSAFEQILQIRNRLCHPKESPAKTLQKLLNEVYYKMPAPLKGVSFKQEADKISGLLAQFANSPLLSKLKPLAFYEALAKAAAKLDVYPDHSDDAIEITGFLDLPFRHAQRIILCGMNEGLLPETITPTNFLNDTKRGILGLPVNSQRFARDWFYLYTILNDTTDSEFIVCKTDDKGAPLRASTLFFTDGKNLEKRAGILFSTPELPEEKSSDHTQAYPFTIQPDLSRAFGSKDDPELIQLSVTGFEAVLENVLDAFFDLSMKLMLKDYEADELDNMSFGTIAHAALENFDVQSCRTGQEAVDTLIAEFSAELEKKCGKNLPLAIRIQKEMFLNRMIHTAKKLFEEKDNYEVVLKKEWKLNQGSGIVFHNTLIRGTIDRIEMKKDQQTGIVILRLIDFKTTDKGEPPQKTHLKGRGNNKTFKDLQLPLYRLLLPLDKTFWEDKDVKKFIPNGYHEETVKFVCGYFNIPKAVTGTGYSMWCDMENMLDKAESTLDDALRIIRNARAGTIKPFSPGEFCNFKEFYQPTLQKAVPSVNWEEKQ